MTLEQQWYKWHKQNPAVWRLFVKFTFEAINAGRSHYSVNAIIERIRWHTQVETVGSEFKISNNHRAYYARYFHKVYPKHNGFFRTKELRSVVTDPYPY